MIVAVMVLSSALTYASHWKIIAESNSCDEKIRIKAKEGEKFIIIDNGKEQIKLFSKDNTEFHEKNLAQKEFVAKKAELEIVYIQPSYTDGSPPKINFSNKTDSKRCRLQLTP